MSLRLFLGGIASGIATTSALLSKDEYSFRTTTDNNVIDTSDMDTNQIYDNLLDYSLKSNSLQASYSVKRYTSIHDCSEIPVDVYSNSFLDRIRYSLSNKFIPFNRNIYCDGIYKYAIALKKLFRRYRPVFVKANQILASNGIIGVSLNGFTMNNRICEIDNSLNYDDWKRRVEQLEDNIFDFSEQTDNAAEKLRTIV